MEANPTSFPATLLTIGTIRIGLPVVLAPMAGYTDAAMRGLCRDFGCGLTYTEVANAAGLVHGSVPTFDLLETAPNEHPVAAHIYGSDPEIMAEAAVQIRQLGRFDLVDINCGCPVRKIVAKGAGAALMTDPERIRQIVEAVREAGGLPVTVKTRSGPAADWINISETAHAAEEGGAAAIAVHARPASQRHRGDPDWGLLAQIKRERNIPVMGNGGTWTARDAVRMLEETGVDAVMIARAAIGNPWIFAATRRLLAGDPWPGHTLDEHLSVVQRHLDGLVDLKQREYRGRRRRGTRLTAEQAAALHFRGHLHQYLRGFRGWSDVRRGLNDIRTPDDVMAAVRRVIARQASDVVGAEEL